MQNRDAVNEFWLRCRSAVEGPPRVAPDAWAFGATPEHADSLLRLVLAGTKTATASALWDYEVSGDPLPEIGALSIILDGAGDPRALIETTAVTIVPFDDVDDEHAFAEGEGDRSLAYWRQEHERFWRAHMLDSRGFEAHMPIVCERFSLRWPST